MTDPVTGQECRRFLNQLQGNLIGLEGDADLFPAITDIGQRDGFLAVVQFSFQPLLIELKLHDEGYGGVGHFEFKAPGATL